MANTSVFTGADGSLALSTQQTPEGTPPRLRSTSSVCR